MWTAADFNFARQIAASLLFLTTLFLFDHTALGQVSNNPRAAPYPASKIATGIEWAPVSTIVRQAKGSDNWPLTWADDDQQYTAYGDGWGFQIDSEVKLSMGVSQVQGGPTNFKGIDIPSESAERLGHGETGIKASGILMVDGVLYMLVRNASNSQLGWSEDHGRTWVWSDWKFTTSFGCPTFLNFGKNYTGSRDEFVYVYSHDADSAYEASDRMVLARVPTKRIRDRDAYEFFQSVDEEGTPVWTEEIEERGAVFSHSGRCFRSGITYNATLKRYFWCQILPESTDSRGPRFQGGFGVYEAPEPWGPWRTVFFSNDWDVGPGDTCSFPTKWMSEDGVTMYLVFSGDDCFSVRKAQLVQPEIQSFESTSD